MKPRRIDSPVEDFTRFEGLVARKLPLKVKLQRFIYELRRLFKSNRT